MRIGLSLAVSLLVAGCGPPGPVDDPAVARAEREVADAVRVVKATCAEAAGRDRPARGTARRAVDDLVRLGVRDENRELLLALARFLEERRCMTSEVPRIDRALREMPPPEHEGPVPEEYEEEYCPYPYC